jgi:hypothetical protein
MRHVLSRSCTAAAAVPSTVRISEPLARIWSDPEVQGLARETARQSLSGAGFYLSNAMITVNGWLALLGVAIIAGCK